jgi:hypothetical protein
MPQASDFSHLTKDLDFSNSLILELADLNVVSVPRVVRYQSPSGQPLWMNEFGHLGSQNLRITDLGLELLEYVTNPLPT